MEIKEMLGELEGKLSSALEGKMDAKAKEVFQKEIKAAQDKIEADLKKAKEDADASLELKLKEHSDKVEALKTSLEKLDVKFKSKTFGEGSEKGKKTFSEFIGKIINDADSKNFLKSAGSGRKFGNMSLSFKAAGDENEDFSNFSAGTYEQLTTERRGLYQTAFAQIWLRNLLPHGNTQNATIYYPRYSGNGAGAAAVWDGTPAIDDLANKPGVNYDFDDVSQAVITIAGVTRVKREMLDDLPWLQSFLSQQLTTGRRGLFVAENAQILAALNANSVAYDGSTSRPLVEQLYDAALGQMADSALNANLIVMNARDLVNEIALNKATTSGLYNLPAGAIISNGSTLSLAGIPVVGLPTNILGRGEGFVLDTNQTQFVTRMSPELASSDSDRDNFVKNLITFRAEERIATLVLDTNAVIKISNPTT